jgi:uncharacterized membrane protein
LTLSRGKNLGGILKNLRFSYSNFCRMQEAKIQIQELYLTTYQWLKACGIKANIDFVKDELTAHPDYPALTSIVDLLNAGNMEYLAVRTSLEHVNEFRYPLLAHIKKGTDEQGLVIVHNENEWANNNDLANKWTGVLLMPEKNTTWKHADNDEYIRRKQDKKQLSIAAFITLFALTLATITQQLALATIFFTLLSAAGLIIAWLTFTTELGLQNDLVKQVCNSINPTGGCGKVLKSKQAKGIVGISPADAALAWFTAQLIFIIAGTWVSTLISLQSIVLQLSLIGIVVAIWSIISQKFVIKQWCALCLGLAAVLLLQFATALINMPTAINIKAGFVYFFILSTLMFLVINPIKQVLKTSLKQKPLEKQLKKWKQDANVFLGLWQQQPIVDCTPWQHELQVGNPIAPTQIIVACNPYCWPCAAAHKKLDELVEKHNKKLGVSIRFSVNAKRPYDSRTTAVQFLLQTILEKSNAAQALADWFNWMNEEKWKEKYKPDAEKDVSYLLLQHDEWAKNVKIAFTPTFFINGRQLPGQYSLGDLSNLLPQLTEILQPEEELVA